MQFVLSVSLTVAALLMLWKIRKTWKAFQVARSALVLLALEPNIRLKVTRASIFKGYDSRRSAWIASFTKEWYYVRFQQPSGTKHQKLIEASFHPLTACLRHCELLPHP